MRPIEWQSRFETGIAEVDFEHKNLIDLVNRALEQFEASTSQESTSETLGEIDAKITAHFALEEKIMRGARYPGYAAHKADHERLLDDIRAIMDANEAGEYAKQAECLAERLSTWFTAHFKTEDARFHAFMSAK